MARKRKHRPADGPDIVTPPPAAEAATDVVVLEPVEVSEPIDVDEDVVLSCDPTTVTPWDEPIPPWPQPPAAPGEHAEPGEPGGAPGEPGGVSPGVVKFLDDRLRQISAGKLIAKHLRIPPASAQLQAGQLSREQIADILSVQLEPDAAERIRATIG